MKTQAKISLLVTVVALATMTLSAHAEVPFNHRPYLPVTKAPGNTITRFKPDLTVASAKLYTPKIAVVTIKNQSVGTNNTCVVALRGKRPHEKNFKTLKTLVIPKMGMGQLKQIWLSNGQDLNAPNYQLQVEVDIYKAIPESNEKNNIRVWTPVRLN